VKVQCDCYDFVHENVGNPALNTRPTILNHFIVHFYYFRDGLAKKLEIDFSKINVCIYLQNIKLCMKSNYLKQREILSLTQHKSETMPLK
jgi:hypothetical protein